MLNKLDFRAFASSMERWDI